MSALLEIEGLEAWYGATQALFGVDLQINAGEVVSLLGRNGMGKSTTILSICGMMQKRRGRVSLNGADLAKMASHRIARRGIGLVPEGRRAFPNLSVLENLTAAATPGLWDTRRVYDLFPRLEERSGQSAATLSGGEQQMLVIGRALMTNPQLLLLDEATEGLAPVIRQEIWASIHKLKAEGMSILIVDKVLKELMALADTCFVLERGETVWSGTPADVTPDLSSRYLGVYTKGVEF